MTSRDPAVANASSLYAKSSDVGLKLIKTHAVGTNVPAVTVTGVFSAEFQNYKIMYIAPIDETAAPDYLFFFFGDFIVGEFIYETQGILMQYGSISPAGNFSGEWFAGYGADGVNYMNIDVFNPYTSLPKNMTSTFKVSGGLMTVFNSAASSTSYTDFTIGSFGGAFNGGTIYVYGYEI